MGGASSENLGRPCSEGVRTSASSQDGFLADKEIPPSAGDVATRTYDQTWVRRSAARRVPTNSADRRARSAGAAICVVSTLPKNWSNQPGVDDDIKSPNVASAEFPMGRL